MTDHDRIAEIQAREQATTPGPWTPRSRDIDKLEESSVLGWEIDGPPDAMRAQFGRGADARFIAHARGDIPWLIGLIAERDSEIARLQEALEFYSGGKYYGARARAALEGAPDAPEVPEVVCLCGSTRFAECFQAENLRLTLEGKIVLSIGANVSDQQLGIAQDSEAKAMLDELHLRKIDLADRIHVLNVGGYIGESTGREIAYAKATGKEVTYLEEAGK